MEYLNTERHIHYVFICNYYTSLLLGLLCYYAGVFLWCQLDKGSFFFSSENRAPVKNPQNLNRRRMARDYPPCQLDFNDLNYGNIVRRLAEKLSGVLALWECTNLLEPFCHFNRKKNPQQEERHPFKMQQTAEQTCVTALSKSSSSITMPCDWHTNLRNLYLVILFLGPR